MRQYYSSNASGVASLYNVQCLCTSKALKRDADGLSDKVSL